MTTPTATTQVLRRNVVTDSSGELWDLANPNIIAIKSSNSGSTTDIVTGAGTFTAVGISFSVASAAFNES